MTLDKTKVIVKVPLALDAEVSFDTKNTEIVNPPTLIIAVDRAAYEADRTMVMTQIYRRVDRIQQVAREKGLTIIELLKERGYIQ